MSAASPDGTLTADHPQAVTPMTPVSRPSLFVSTVWLLLVVELSWAIAGVVVAMAGVFSLGTVLPVWGVLTVALWSATRAARRAGMQPVPRTTTWCRLAAVAVVAVSVALNAAFPGEHLQAGRDGGTYTATAGWITTDGDLLIEADPPPFDEPAGLQYNAAGFEMTDPDGPLYAQFMHAFPAMMATVNLAGGLDWMVTTNAVIGGLALLALYAFAERVTRPWAALLAQLALAANLVFIYFTRAPFSELLTMGLLFAGLWALDQAVAQRGRATAFVAGLFLGGTFLARLDGLVVLLMIIVALLPPVVGGRLRRVAPAGLLGVGVSCAIALVDLFVFSPVYVDMHVRFLVPLGLGFVAAGAVAVLAGTGPGRTLVRGILRRRRQVAIGLAIAIVVGGVLVYTVRPSFAGATWDLTTPIGPLQQAEGQPVDESRTYAELSARWLGWYLGVPALAVALVGWAGLVRQAVVRRQARLAPFLLSVSALTTLYVWMPSITPDHIWAARRFLPVVLPGLVVCAAWVLDRAWRAAGRVPWRVPARVAVAFAAALLVAGPLARSAPLIGLREYGGLTRDVTRACDLLGDDAALLLLNEDDSSMHHFMTQPLRAHCGVPAVWASITISNERLVELAARARAGDRTLYLLAERRTSFDGRPVGAIVPVLRHRGVRLEATLTTPPRELEGYGLDVLAAPVTPAVSGRTQVTTTWIP
jgi:hypothetical protein